MTGILIHNPQVLKLADAFQGITQKLFLAPVKQYQKPNILVLDTIPGQNLTSLLTTTNFNESQLRHFLYNMLAALKVLHSYNIIYSNWQLTNIILDNQGDFILNNWHLTNDFNPEYLAPEQLLNKPELASDLYSLGVISLQLLTGINPLQLWDNYNDMWIWRDYLISPLENLGLAAILDQLVNPNLKQRFNSVDQVLTKLGKKYYVNLNNYQRSSWEISLEIKTITPINDLSFSKDHQIVGSGNNGIIYFWDNQKGTEIKTITTNQSSLSAIALSPTDPIVASGSNHIIKLWNYHNDQELLTLNHEGQICAIVFTNDGQYLISGGTDKTVKIWNIKTTELEITLLGHKLAITDLAISPDGKWIISGSSDRTAKLWDRKGKLVHNLENHIWSVLAVAFHPNKEIVATGSDDNTIKQWNYVTGQELSTIAHHSWSVLTLAYSPDGQYLISGSADQTVRIWKGTESIAILKNYHHPVSLVAVSINQIATFSMDQKILVYNY